ncbi:MAG: NAD-dependent epimerase/dehydratase family protein [Clostridiales bacterium]|nr:NAD-dependent epimerase/dehydratase family protein [Clostridiales bacterium]
MNIVINGASGYIGYHLTNELLNQGHTVYAICRSKPGFLEKIENNDNLKIITTSQQELEESIKDKAVDVFYHLLWEGACGELRASPEIQIKNELMALSALRIAEKIGCKKIIFTGTVYERLVEIIIKDDKFNKNSFYIISKAHTHQTTYELSKSMDIDYIWVQFCHPIGLYMGKNQLIPYAINAFRNNEETAFGKCENYFDIISVEDLAKALATLGVNDTKKNFYYIGSDEPKQLKSYITKAAELCGYKLEIGFGKRKDDGLIFEKEWFDSSSFVNEFYSLSENGFENAVKSMLQGDN